MGDFLTAVSTVSLRSNPITNKLIVEEVVAERPTPRTVRKSPASPDEALHILRSSPDQDALHDLLLFLSQPSQQSAGFDIKIPTPSSAKLVNELINTTLPDFWGSDDQTNVLLLDCLRSVAGIGGILAKLRSTVSKYQSARRGVQGSESTQPLSDLISILSQLLCSDHLAENVYDDINTLVESQPKRTLLWKELLTLVGTGKIVASAAEAEDTVKSAGGQLEPSWLSNGSRYSAWLGRNVCTMLHKVSKDTSTCKAAAQLCGKALGIGYPVQVVEKIHAHITFVSPNAGSKLQPMLQSLQVHEQKQLLDQTFKVLSKQCLPLMSPPDFDDTMTKTPSTIAAASATIMELIEDSEAMRGHLETWLSDPAQNASESFGLRRAAVSAFAHASKGTTNMLE
ncbi:hypothetical protein KCU67_g10900, partial [Aureobasidium melanogenum]